MLFSSLKTNKVKWSNQNLRAVDSRSPREPQKTWNQVNRQLKTAVTAFTSLWHGSILDSVQNLYVRPQAERTTWVAMIVERKMEAWSVPHTNFSHGATREKLGTLRERDACLNWSAAWSTVRCLRHQYRTRRCFCTWKFWILLTKDGHLDVFYPK